MNPAFKKVSVTNCSSDNIPYEEFLQSSFAKTPIGRLYIALVEENSWSNDFQVYASLGGENPFLTISNKYFPYTKGGTRSILIQANELGTVPTIQQISILILEKFHEHEYGIKSAIADLEDTRYRVEAQRALVLVGLARTAVLSKIPNASCVKASHDSSLMWAWFENEEGTEAFAIHGEALLKMEPISVYHLSNKAAIQRFKDAAFKGYTQAVCDILKKEAKSVE